MLLIKISDNPERYVNTDLIEVVTFGRQIPIRRRNGADGVHNGALLDFRSGRTIPISDNAGRVLIEFAEANSAFIEDTNATPGVISTERATPIGGNELPLKSRIAQYLRDESPNGAMIMDLVMKFPGKDTEIPVALAELQKERVVMLVTDRYYHASNAPREVVAPDGDGF